MLQAIAVILSKVTNVSSKRENTALFGRIIQRWNGSNVPEAEIIIRILNVSYWESRPSKFITQWLQILVLSLVGLFIEVYGFSSGFVIVVG